MWKDINNNLIASSEKCDLEDDFHTNLVRRIR